jgi:alkyl hydroperoxide reductase subunit AhpC
MEETTHETCYCGCEVAHCGVRVGQKVPDFEIETYEPSTGTFGAFSLAAAKANGKWTVLVFYPADFTFICPTELADLADKHGDLQKLGCEVVSVSTDTKFAHYGWHQQEQLLKKVTYHMGSDPKRAVSQLFGVYDEESGLAVLAPGNVGAERGFDVAASVEPGGFERLVKYIRVTEASLGDGVKKVYASEQSSLKKLRRVNGED